jgi:hypothetical protein
MLLILKISLIFCFVFVITMGYSQCPDGYQVGGADRAINGQFNDGNTGISSEYTYVANGSGQSELNPEGYFSVWNNPRDLHSNFAVNHDIAGTGSMMIINGSPTANQFVWKQTIVVDPNTLYYFVTDVASVHPTSPAQLQFSINGGLDLLFNATADSLQWHTFYTTWNSQGNSTAIISIVNQNTAASGNDFALDNISFVPCNIILPVELVDFDVKQNDCNHVNILWQTASETNNNFFTIERSFNGKIFEMIGQIASKNSNSKVLLNYSFVDSETLSGMSYYRLKQTDFDGKSKYSKVVSIKTYNPERELTVSVFPNPSISKVNIDFTGNKGDIESIKLINVYGETIYESPFYQAELCFENLNSGMYILQVILNSKKTIEKRFLVK